MQSEQDKLKEEFHSQFSSFLPEDGFLVMPDGGYRSSATRMLFYGWQAANSREFDETTYRYKDLQQGYLLMPETPRPLMLAAFNLAGISSPRDSVAYSELFKRAYEKSEKRMFEAESQAFLTVKDFNNAREGKPSDDFLYAHTGWQVARAKRLSRNVGGIINVTVSEDVILTTAGLIACEQAHTALVRVLRYYTRQLGG